MCSTASTDAQPTQPRKYIAFRDDDVAPFTSLEPLEAVNQVHIDEGVPVTLGIIPQSQALLHALLWLKHLRGLSPYVAL